MEYAKTPSLGSWVLWRASGAGKIPADPCPLCPENQLANFTTCCLGLHKDRGRYVFSPHFRSSVPDVEGDPARGAEGIYERMDAVER